MFLLPDRRAAPLRSLVPPFTNSETTKQMIYHGYYAALQGKLLETTTADTNSWGADAQSCLTPPSANPVVLNATPVPAQPLAVTKDATGATLSANGRVPVSVVSITFRNPGLNVEKEKT